MLSKLLPLLIVSLKLVHLFLKSVKKEIDRPEIEVDHLEPLEKIFRALIIPFLYLLVTQEESNRIL